MVTAKAWAQDGLNTGDTAWVLTFTALVLFMTIPGLALFYSALVRTKNVLSVLMQCFALTAVVAVIWLVAGYSMAFDTTGMVAGTVNVNSFIGTLNKAFLHGVAPNAATTFRHTSARSTETSTKPRSAGPSHCPRAHPSCVRCSPRS